MISLLRNFFQSKIGLPIFIGFLLLVLIAFAMADVTGSATFGGLSGDDKIVVIGGEGVASNEVTAAVNNGLDRARQQNPAITMPDFVEQGGLEDELNLLIDRYAVGLFAKDHGLRAGDNLVNSEILKISAFRNLTGEFDQATYQAALRRQNITDAILRKDLADGLLNQQVLRPAFAAPRLPAAAARHYASLVLERRQGNIALIPSRDYAPDGDPSNKQLTDFYAANRADFVVPERRTLRFARFGADSVSAAITPTEAQIAARYKEDAAAYAAQERRAISSFVVPTEAAARALVERIRGGVPLETAAAAASFNVSKGDLRDRAAMASSTSFALAEAVFGAKRGDVLDPERSQLGWYVARVDEVESIPARSLAQVRDQISEQIKAETLTNALDDLSAEIEQAVDSGTSLTDVAEKYGLTVDTVANVQANGVLFGTEGQRLSQALLPIIETAFQMEESAPQLAVIEAGSQFLIFDVSDIVESAAPPLAQVRAEVTEAWRRSEGAKEARKAADRILAAVRGGKSLPDAMRAENPALNQLERIDLERRQLLATAQQTRPPAALVLMFSMAQGSTKLLEDQNDLGWFIVDLDRIVAPKVEESNPVFADTRNQIGSTLSLEYNQQLLKAIREEVGVDRNEEAIEDLRRVLAGAN